MIKKRRTITMAVPLYVPIEITVEATLDDDFDQELDTPEWDIVDIEIRGVSSSVSEVTEIVFNQDDLIGEFNDHVGKARDEDA